MPSTSKGLFSVSSFHQKSVQILLSYQQEGMLRLAEYHMLWIPCLQPSGGTCQLIPTAWRAQGEAATVRLHPLLPAKSPQRRAWDATGFPHPSCMDTPNQKAGYCHWNERLWVLQWEASGKPWMFYLNSILLMKSRVSQQKAASTPSSAHVPFSCLPSPFLCILILCMSEECGKCAFFRLL